MQVTPSTLWMARTMMSRQMFWEARRFWATLSRRKQNALAKAWLLKKGNRPRVRQELAKHAKALSAVAKAHIGFAN